MPQSARTFRIFVSSTFEDLKAERNALQERVFPRLRALCLARGARFQAIDLRWGVGQEVALDQQALPICLAEIERCRKASPRPNFIALLGDRYGWRPLPAEIPEAEYDEIRGGLSADARDLLEAWYLRDGNAVPPVYDLRPRKGAYARPENWTPLERRLRVALERAAVGLPEEARRKYVASATEQEIVAGALDPQVAPDAEQHVFAFFRRIEGLPSGREAAGFRDLDEAGQPDGDAVESLERLKLHLRERLGGNVREYDARWMGTDADRPSPPVTLSHLDRLCEDVYACLEEVILREIDQLEQRGALDLEIEAHRDFARERTRHFVGRRAALGEIARYLAGSNPKPLVVVGPAGSGKSALVAEAMERARADRSGSALVSRFIGASPASSNGLALLDGLCREIGRECGGDEPHPGADYPELARAFQDRLALASPDRPLLVFLDAVDQLRAGDPARNLAWLPTQLPPNVRLVVSTVPEVTGETLRVRLDTGPGIEVDPMPLAEAEAVLDLWLAEAGRTLTAVQRTALIHGFRACPRPLYLKLAFDEARHWRSHDPNPSPELPPDIPGMIDRLLHSVEVHHGELLASRSLGLLAASKNGLGEDEILDLLARDDEYFEHFRATAHHELPELGAGGQRLPVVVWSRLYLDLEPLLTERSADGTHLFTFYHRQLGEGVARRYLRDEGAVARHRDLSAYFREVPLRHEQGGERVPNLRKLSELPFQQAHAQLWNELEGTLLDLSFLEAKVDALGPLPVIDDCDEGMEAGYPGRAVRLVGGALRLSTHVLDGDRSQLRAQLLGRLGSGHPGVGRLLAQARRWRGRLWLRPLRPTLTRYGGPSERILAGHSGEVTALASTPDGRRVASGSKDNTLRVWDLDTGAVLVTLEGHTDWVTSVAVTPDGRRVASGSMDGTLRVWDLETGATLAKEGGPGDSEPVESFATPDGRRGFSAQGGALQVWDLEALMPLAALEGHSGWSPLAVTPDGGRVVSHRDGTLRVWDLHTGAVLATLEGHLRRVWSVAVTPDGRRAVSGSADRRLRVWDLETGSCIATLEGHTHHVFSVAVTPDGRRAVSGSSDDTLRLWELDTGTLLATLEGHSNSVGWVGITRDGHRAVSGSWDTTVRMWDLDAGAPLATFEGHSNTVVSVALTPDGRRAVSASEDGTLRVWDLEAGPPTALQRHSRRVNSVAVAPEGRCAVSGSVDRMLRLWDLETGAPLATLQGHTGSVSRVVVTRDGRRAVSASWDCTLRVWNLETRSALAVLEGHSDYVTALAVTPDGRRAVSGSMDDTLRVWELETGAMLATLEGHSRGVGSVALATDGRRVVSTSNDRTIRVWDLEANAPLEVLEGDWDLVGPVSLSPDGRHVVSGSPRDRTVRVWDLERGAALATLAGHSGVVRSLAVTPDGRRVVSGSGDRTLRVWDLQTGALLATLVGHSRPVNAVAVLADGRRVVSGSGDRTLRVWDLEGGDPLACFATEGSVGCVASASDGRTVVAGDSQGAVHFLVLEQP